MVREDILGGLRAALSRGQTLRQAMMSFYNAGYVKEEIEEAAKVLQAEKNQPPQYQSQTPVKQAEVFQRTDNLTSPAQTTPQTTQVVSAYGQPGQQPAQLQTIQQPQQTTQVVSAYGMPAQIIQQPQPATKPTGKAVIYILIALLIILVIGLIAVFFFKDEILSFFNST